MACAASLLLLILGKTEGRARRYYFHRMICQLHKEGLRKGIGSEIPVYVINRKFDERRLASFLQAANRHGIRPERIEALDAKEPEFDWTPHEPWIADTFFGSEKFPRGSVGCFLSHLSAWKKVANCQAEGALICEDDAVLLGPLPKQWKEFNIPKDADFVFCNRRMAENLLQKKSLRALNRKFQAVPVYDILHERFQKTSLAMEGLGLEAYLITRACASRIIAMPELVRLFMNNDWHTLLCSLSDSERVEILKPEGTNRFINVTEKMKKIFTSNVIMPPFAEGRWFPTVIEMSKKSLLIKRKMMR